MASGRTQLDELVGEQPEDLVRKHYHPDAGHEGDKAANEASHSGGESKLPSNIMPFKLGD